MSRRPKSCREFADELNAAGISASVLDGSTIFASTGGTGRFAQRVRVYFDPSTGRFTRAESRGEVHRSMAAVRRYLGLAA